MESFDLSQPVWRTSSRSSGNGQCVEVALAATAAHIRDTKNRNGGALTFSKTSWAALIENTRTD